MASQRSNKNSSSSNSRSATRGKQKRSVSRNSASRGTSGSASRSRSNLSRKSAAPKSTGDYSRPTHIKGAPSHSKPGRDYSRSQIQYVAPAAEKEFASNGYSRSVSSQNYSSMRRKSRKRKRILIAVIAVVAALVIGGGGAAFAYINYINGQLHSGIDDMDALNAALVTSAADTDPFYMLLMGTDGRDGDTSERSDTIILARVDPGEKRVVLISIPRDTRVYIDGHGYQKINAAHAYGGAAGAVEAVENFAGVEISHYAEVNFAGFKGLVDAIGGVEVDVPQDIEDWDAGGVVYAGYQTLNGEQALIFCRTRATAIGDYQRQANQRMFLQALASKVLASDPATILSAVNAIASAVSTDMTVDSIYSLAMQLRGMDSSNIYTYTVPSTPQTIDGISYVVANETEWKNMMATIDAGGLPETQDWTLAGVQAEEYQNGSTSSSSSNLNRSSYALTVRNGGGIEGSASAVAEKLQNLGYVINDTGNTNQFAYDTTLVVYNNDADLPYVNDIISNLGMGTAVQSAGRYSFDGNIMVVVGKDWSS